VKATAAPFPADLTDEDAARLEEERREHIASIRRKFKEQHKQILQALQSKHKEDERKVGLLCRWWMAGSLPSIAVILILVMSCLMYG